MLLLVKTGNGIKISHVVPAEGAGNHCNIASSSSGLSNGVVDCGLGESAPRLFHNALTLGSVPSLGDLHNPGVKLRLVLFKMLQHQGYGCHEHTGVPGVVPGIQVFLCGFAIGFFNKRLDRKGVRCVSKPQWSARSDISERARRLGGGNADSDNLS